MLAAGAARTNVLHQRPADVTGGWRPGDERFDAVTARRPVIEAAVAGVAAGTPGLTIRRGTRVSGLVTAGRSAVPRVVGVRTDGGDLAADLVVDADRQARLDGRLDRRGGRPRPRRDARRTAGSATTPATTGSVGRPTAATPT